MPRRWEVVVLATCLAGCGGFLSLTGDDEQDEPTGPPANVDGSADGRDDEGGSNAPPSDAGKEVGASIDAAPDAKLDGASDGPGNMTSTRYVFVTSSATKGGFGVAAADGICKTRADLSSLAALQGRNWHAWISTSTPAENAAQRIGGNTTIVFRLPDSVKVADNLADLVDGSLDHAIDRDENGTFVADDAVWTASSPAGLYVSSDCINWTSAVSQSILGRVGSTGSVVGTWTDNTDRACTLTARLYCFEY